ncbi:MULTISPECIES: ABC transporter ATP-binding protein [Rhizobium]|uniref:ABC transporter ATP-binding protein n=1 Tax=Rhizobium TaxID=379 RepID=UPI001ADD20C1|nr:MULTISPECIES: ABC transporter ATP-binding protein [unclassified Rhizobium]MBO9101792.1 ABC transporter ATP-binding protein [Rhizobium sp. L58/93]MBO9171963.1 ABC transporter ATP-binding protein [Rhizobium sp. L245/93]MBO9187824.1 ABC transporter ATP-binding protein [Rhizobium sp. E27B/91]QXZ87747.1 ABC transporter ATP-binding protein [Rhizobium sp. K1/93]QXZ93787.1 ABC transporter ATP-binding protein [Rhizobium sp. K15/93]
MLAPLLDIRDLKVGFRAPTGYVEAVKGVSFTLGRERLAIVGESGSGKSMTVRALLGLAGHNAIVTAEQARFCEMDLLRLTGRQLSAVRGHRIAMVVQDPRQGLNPIQTAGRQIAEMLRLHRRTGRSDMRKAVETLLDEVHIRNPRRVFDLYPHELSGGMAQRVMIAMMLAGGPDILIADEATSALDAVVQRRILELIDEQVRLRGMGLILISHDLELVSDFADRILVMYAGRTVETLTSGQGYQTAQHPYTRGLIACVPSLDDPGRRLPVLTRDPDWAR